MIPPRARSSQLKNYYEVFTNYLTRHNATPVSESLTSTALLHCTVTSAHKTCQCIDIYTVPSIQSSRLQRNFGKVVFCRLPHSLSGKPARNSQTTHTEKEDSQFRTPLKPKLSNVAWAGTPIYTGTPTPGIRLHQCLIYDDVSPTHSHRHSVSTTRRCGHGRRDNNESSTVPRNQIRQANTRLFGRSRGTISEVMSATCDLFGVIR